MRTITVAVTDKPAADSAATDLLQDAVTFRDDGLGYRAAWIGAPSTLGAFETHRDARISPPDLAAVVRGQSVRSGEQVRPWHLAGPPALDDRGNGARDHLGRPSGRGVPSVSSRVMTIEAPDSLTREWFSASPERQEEIGRALTASAETALEYVRQHAPMVQPSRARRERQSTFAHGIAGAAIVRPPAAPGADNDAPLRVDVVIFGVENRDGKIVIPDDESVLAIEERAETAAHDTLDKALRDAAIPDPRLAARDGLLRAREDLLVVEARGEAAHSNAVPTLRERQAQLMHELGHLVENARPPGRDDVSVPRAIDQLRDVVGPRIANDLAREATPLAAWLAEQPEDWLRARYAELGPPARDLSRMGARALQRIETARIAAQDQLSASSDDAGPPSLDFPQLTRLAKAEQQLHAQGIHPDRWLAGRDRIVRSLAYGDELAIRRELVIRQAVERSVADPPAHLVELIGPEPGPDAPERGEWLSTARAIEYQRLAPELDARDGVEPRQPDPQEQRDLDRRIDALRAERGLSSLGEVAEPGGPDFGF